MAKRERSKRSLDEAREFGRLVELERKRSPRDNLETIFYRIRRSAPKRWKSPRSMYRLWADFKKDRQQNPFQAELLAWAQRPSTGPKLRERRPDTGRQDSEGGD